MTLGNINLNSIYDRVKMYRFGNAWKRSMINSIHAPDLRLVKLVCGQQVSITLSGKYVRGRGLVGINIPIQKKIYEKVFLFFTDAGSWRTMGILKKMR